MNAQMNTITTFRRLLSRKSARAMVCLAWVCSWLCFSPSRSHALIPEPDTILYGTIALDGAPVLATQTNVIVEARRSTNGPPIAIYRMGSDPDIGNFYSLRLLLESVAPKTDPSASEAGDLLYIVLRDLSGVRGQTNYTLIARGEVLRIDFGMAVGDSDGDGLPDPWELAKFNHLTNGPGTLTGNGTTVLMHFIAGTDPNNPTDGFRLYIERTNDPLKRVWFVARQATGPGYEGMIRRYTLEFNPVVGAGFWTPVPDYIDLIGSGQTVNYYTAALGQGFYRGRVWLQGYTPPGGEIDTDGDGMPDNWETLYFGSLVRNGSFVTTNRMTALQNYIAGTNPNDPNGPFKLSITRSNNQQWVSFQAFRAQGTGYTGKNRYYALEASTNPAGTYLGVAAYTNVLGNNQSVIYQAPTSPTALFYRGRVWLQSQ
jgi:hypothetical protein